MNEMGEGTPVEVQLGQLAQADAEALEALVTAEFEIENVDTRHRERARRIARLLGLLDAPVAGEGSDGAQRMAKRTASRIAALEQADSDDVAPEVTMAPLDEDALEALVGSGYDPRRVSHSIRERARRHMALLTLLDGPRQDDMTPAQAAEHAHRREALVTRTTTAIAAVRRVAPNLKLVGVDEGGGGRGRFSFRMADLVSIAAMLMVAAAVGWPMLKSMRENSRQTACLSNMAGIASAFGQYGGSNRESLPLASKSQAGTPWWFVGQKEKSNSANLFALVGQKFAKAEMMACPGNVCACFDCPEGAVDWKNINEVSYSFQNLFANHRPSRTAQPMMVVLVDRSPVIPKAIKGEWMRPEENSPNHAGRGQQMLRNDGSAVWTTRPVAPGTEDNVWLPRPVERLVRSLTNRAEAAPLKGTEEPAWADDVFVGP